MPGIDLNLSLPDLNEPFAAVLAKLVTALSAIEDDLASKVMPSEIDVITSLSMNGNALTNTGSVVFVSGNPGSAVGSMYYSGGELYMVTAAGTVKITNAGSVNVVGSGGIGGGYGTGPESVFYTTSTKEYHFTADTGDYADIRLDDLILVGAAGTVRLGVDAALTGDRQFSFKVLNTSGTQMLVYNAATSTVETLPVPSGAGVVSQEVWINPAYCGNSAAPSFQASTPQALGSAVRYGGLRSIGGSTSQWRYDFALPRTQRVNTVLGSVRNNNVSGSIVVQVNLYAQTVDVLNPNGLPVAAATQTLTLAAGQTSTIAVGSVTHYTGGYQLAVDLPPGAEIFQFKVFHDNP